MADTIVEFDGPPEVDVLWVDSTGITIGEAVTRKIGFFGTTPIAQESNITNPVGGATVDAEVHTAIDSILASLEAYGITA